MKDSLIGNTEEPMVLDLLAAKEEKVKVVILNTDTQPEEPKVVLTAKEQRRADRQAQRNEKKGN